MADIPPPIRRHPLMPEKGLLVRIARILAAMGGYRPAGKNTTCVELHSEIREWLGAMKTRGYIE